MRSNTLLDLFGAGVSAACIIISVAPAGDVRGDMVEPEPPAKFGASKCIDPAAPVQSWGCFSFLTRETTILT